MVSITLSVSEKTKKLMNQFPEINWSGFIRKTIQQKVEELTWEQQMLEKLKQQESFDQWAFKTTQKSRDKRIEELRMKGLL